jgi:anti-anti-sigma factor
MYKVLVIDDEKTTLSMFQMFLKAYGYTVLTAENGEKGLEVFDQEKPDLVITDIKMPGMDGMQVLKTIKEESPGTEVIIVTGYGDTDLTVQAMKLNATDFLHKPIGKDALRQALNRAGERLGLLKKNEEQIILTMTGGLAVIDIQGNINASHEQKLLEVYDRIIHEGKSKILFRFKSNSSVNGTGIAILIQILSKCLDKGQKAAITGLSENFQKFFGLVGINRLAGMYETEEQALDSLNEQSGHN